MNLNRDFHCHLLPKMDDGAQSCFESQKILEELKQQGIHKVLATPHFYSHRETIEIFLSRRQEAVCRLQEIGLPVLPIILGAEIHLERGLSELENLRLLAWGTRNYLLLELPYGGFKEWMVEEIYNITFRMKITPVIAHLDRYLSWYKEDEIQEVLEIQDAIIQLNNEALFIRKTLKFCLKLIQTNYPVIFGSDTHNLQDRKPNFEQACSILHAKLKKSDFQRLYDFSSSLIN